MARDCACCSHRDRDALNAALVAGRSPRSIAADFGLNHQSIERHRRNHLPQVIRRAAREVLEREEAALSGTHVADWQSRNEAAEARPRAPQETGEAVHVPTGWARRRGIVLDNSPPAPAASATIALPAASVADGVHRTVPTVPAAGSLNLHEAAIGLRDRAMRILENAERDGDAKTALTAIREARGVLEHLSRLEERQGAAGAAVPLVRSAEWVRTRTALMSALADYPEARIAVAEALAGTGA